MSDPEELRDEARMEKDQPRKGHYEYQHCNWYWVPEGDDEEAG